MPDILKDGPALSATSDSILPASPPPPPPVADPPTPAPPEDSAAAKTGEGEEAKTEAVDPTKAEGDKGETPPAPKKDGLSQRMSELTNARKDAEAARKAADERADKLASSLAEAIETIKGMGGTKAGEAIKAAETADPRPERSKFDDPDAYDGALIEWSTRQATRLASAEFEKKAAEEKTAAKRAEAEVAAQKDREAREAESAKVVKTWAERVTKAVTDFPDFDEVVYREVAEGGPNITEPMRDAILAVENGPALAYHLGKNIAEAARISGLPAVQQLVEMGRLAAELSRAKPKVSKAPDPITPTGSRQAAAPRSDDELSGDEYYAKHAEARRKAARGY